MTAQNYTNHHGLPGTPVTYQEPPGGSLTIEQQQILALYQAMPGAPAAPRDGDLILLGEIDGTDHWQFCAAIVRMAIGAAQAYSR